MPLRTSEVGAKLEMEHFFFCGNDVRNIACIIVVKIFLMVNNNCSTAASTLNSTRPLTHFLYVLTGLGDGHFRTSDGRKPIYINVIKVT